MISLLFLAISGRAQIRNARTYGLGFMSHGLLDYLTSKDGGGVELLWPISTAKVTLGWWGLSEVPSRLTRMEILETLALEAALFSLLLVSMLPLRRSLAKSSNSTAEPTK